ncbi:MAG TPA: hypothetical protein VM032_14215 [Vicinamibacterales bacterium]|nr:hypothetical protein [Vicinamibacterales bacterium]
MRSARQHRLAAIAAALALLFAMVALSRDFGFTWDERFQQKYGEEIWEYLHGRLPRASFDTDEGNQYLYGGLVEIIAVSVQHLVHADTYVVRHAVNAAFGWAGVVVCGLFAARAFGRRAGWLAATLLVLAPRYFGDAMNNPKDVPFAVMAMAVLAVTLSVDWRRPHLSWRRAALLAACIALAINIRPLGLVLLLYAAGVIGLGSLLAAVLTTAGDRWRQFGVTVARLVVVGAVAVPAGSLFWPYAQAQPFVRPLTAFVTTTRLDWARGFDVLFAGQDLGAGAVPWTYVPVWLVMALPPVVLAGCALSWLAARRGLQQAVAWAGLVAFAAAPVVAAIVRNATIYDGIRHLLFVVPPLVALAAGGWSALLETRPRIVGVVLLLIGMAEPLVYQVRNHPNQIVYFTPLMGGPKRAFARYDMDFWGNSVLQAVQWADAVARESGVPLVVSGNPIQAVDADAARYRSLMVVARSNLVYHLDIRLMRGPSGSLREFASRPDILYTVTTADGTPLCVVLPGPAFLSVSDRLRLPPAPSR